MKEFVQTQKTFGVVGLTLEEAIAVCHGLRSVKSQSTTTMFEKTCIRNFVTCLEKQFDPSEEGLEED
jgi:hypothetical protein